VAGRLKLGPVWLVLLMTTVSGQDIARSAYDAALRLEKSGVYEQALTQYLRLIEGRQDEEISLMAKLQAAKIYLNAFKDHEKARAFLEDIAKRIDHPELAAEAVCNLGKVNYEEAQGLNDIQAALGEFQQVILVFRGTPAVAEALLLAAAVEESLGNIENARHHYQSILYESRDSSSAAPAEFRLARCHVVSGNPGAAIEQLQRIRLLYPSTPEAEMALRAASNLYRLYLLRQDQQLFHAREIATLNLDDVRQLEVSGDQLFLLDKSELVTLETVGKFAGKKPAAGIRGIRLERAGGYSTNSDRAVEIKGQLKTVEYQDDEKVKVFDKLTSCVRNSFGESYIVGNFEGIWRLVEKEVKKEKRLIAEPFMSMSGRIRRLRLDTENWFYALSDKDGSLWVLNREGGTEIQIKEDQYKFDSILDFALDGYDNLYLLGKKEILVFDNLHRSGKRPRVLSRVDHPVKNVRRIAVDGTGQIYLACKKGITKMF
jgi:tetratricopeptide (TPR) repeat protein